MRTFCGTLLIIAAAMLGVLADPSGMEITLLVGMGLLGVTIIVDDL